MPPERLKFGNAKCWKCGGQLDFVVDPPEPTTVQCRECPHIEDVPRLEWPNG